jgi:hypothetical protein
MTFLAVGLVSVDGFGRQQVGLQLNKRVLTFLCLGPCTMQCAILGRLVSAIIGDVIFGSSY